MHGILVGVDPSHIVSPSCLRPLAKALVSSMRNGFLRTIQLPRALSLAFFRRTAIERLELVPVLDLPSGRYRPDNFPPFESWVWQKSQCGTEVRGALWKRSKRSPFIAVGIGSEREMESLRTEPVIDEDESDELQDWQLEGYD